MTAEEKIIYLVAGVVAVLAVATLTGRLLRYRQTAVNPVVENLNARINAWWWMFGIFIIAMLTGPIATLILFALISFYALREFLSLTPTRAGDHRSLLIAFFVLIPLQYYLIGSNWYGLFSILIPVYGFLLLPVVSALAGETDEYLARVAKIQWGVMISIYCISHAPALLLLDIPGYKGQSLLLMFYLLLIVQMSDVLQYVFGKLFGRIKIAPRLSPSKTLEGLIGGGLGAVGIGAAMWWITPFTPLQAAGMALVIVAMGFLGGLSLSAVKRSLGAKDWGRMIEGHGGMMDRMDSVSFAAPVFFHLTRYFFSG